MNVDPPPSARTFSRSAFRGCLLGGAVGDALGAPVEFLPSSAIKAKYGSGGIRDMDVAYGVKGAITDDTQMTLFTADGLIRANSRQRLRGICNPLGVIRDAYLRWLATQGEVPIQPASALHDKVQGWLYREPGLHARRAPGNTCISALRADPTDPKGAADNDSKGCGGVMRIAPVGLVADDPFQGGIEVAHLTHGHVYGHGAAGVMAHIVGCLRRVDTMQEAVRSGLEKAVPMEGVHRLLEQAIQAAASDRSPEACIEDLGEGWVGEEALAIAVFCALRASTFEEGVIMAVNHSGDSDSTGSMAGQLLGVAMGEEAIPERWLRDLELRDVIRQVADDLYDWFVEGVMQYEDGWPTLPKEWLTRYPPA